MGIISIFCRTIYISIIIFFTFFAAGAAYQMTVNEVYEHLEQRLNLIIMIIKSALQQLLWISRQIPTTKNNLNNGTETLLVK